METPIKTRASRRAELDSTLRTILGSSNIYYQPPENTKITTYPAIVYTRTTIDPQYADNLMYLNKTCYEITLIDRRPDSPLIDLLMDLPSCRYLRHVSVSGVNNDTFRIYY